MRGGSTPFRLVEAGDRRDADRRSGDRRAPRRWLDPLFAATLVNQVAPAETHYARGYGEAPRGPRAGIVVNVSA
jgi:hypothetical protein